MTGSRCSRILVGAFALVAYGGSVLADGEGQRGPGPPLEGQRGVPQPPIARGGNAIFPALEGWFKNADGTFTLLVGYYNRNETAVEIPIGPNNRLDPGGPDMAQPTYFLPRRHRGVFAITVPADFGARRITWTLNAYGQPQTIPLWLNPPYVIDPFRNPSDGNTPPRLRFTPAGPETVAISRRIAHTLDARVDRPLDLALWATDEGAAAGRGAAAAVTLFWSKYRGPGEVSFENATPAFANGRADTRARFSAVGEYWLRALVNDASGEGGGGQQCCWTNALVRVTVR